jgi:hypothetical protein
MALILRYVLIPLNEKIVILLGKIEQKMFLNNRNFYYLLIKKSPAWAFL